MSIATSKCMRIKSTSSLGGTPSRALGVVVGVGIVVGAVLPGCASKAQDSCFECGDVEAGANGGGGSYGSTSSSGGSGFLKDASAAPTPTTADGGVVCPSGLECDVSCSGGGTTGVTGKVFDPAGKNPLYNVAVYVPAVALAPLPAGVPTGADACSCSALFKSGAVVDTVTGVDGSFTLNDVPVGQQVPLVIQVGKWRHKAFVNTTACGTTVVPDGTLKLPGTVAAGDTDDNMPDIAVSTGEADSLECLMIRMGIPASEYVAGAGGAGHVHVFAGGNPGNNNSKGSNAGSSAGRPESPGMSGAPSSPTSLWANQAQLMPFDIVLLSCEGGETYSANPEALEAYLNAGGRAFGSHFHYAWFSGPLASTQKYSAPSDWGSNLATWTQDSGQDNGPIGGVIDTTLNGTGKPFPKGLALQQWLGDVDALGANISPATELSIYQPRYNATVSAANKPSQPWITSDSTGMSGSTMYFSFDTPVDAANGPSGTPNYCGRAVFSDLHVAGDPTTSDGTSPPGTCATGDLSPQEKALEFMLFDLSSCVIPDTIAPPDGGVPSPAQ